MPSICQECKSVFGERTEGGRKSCPKCGSNKVYVPSKKNIKNIDKSLMPWRLTNKSLNFNDLKFFKFSTYTDEVDRKDYVVFHKKNEQADGNELLVAPSPMKPYYHISVDDYKKNTNSIDKILNKYRATMIDEGAVGTDRRKVFKVEFNNDLDRKSSVFRIEKICRTYESNRPLTNRLALDLSLTVDALPTKYFWDIEVDPRNAPSLTRTDGRILCICGVGNSNKKGDLFLLKDDDDESEREMLRHFFKEAFHWSTSVGFYSAKFDVPYTQMRALRLGMGWDWDFLSVMDMHNIYTVMQLFKWDDTKFNLQNIAMNEFGEGKVEIENYQILWDMWKNKDPKLLEYCYQDSDLIRRLDEKWNGIDNRLITTNLTYTRPDAYVAYMQGLESMVVKILNQRKPKEVLYTPFRKRWEAKIEGALVFDPIKGTHDNVVFLDFKSMYNRIMQTFNIGFDTIDDNGEIITPKARFTNKRDSVVREVLNKLEYWREFYKQKRDSYDMDDPMWNIYEKKQWIFKYFLVSLFGVMSSPWSFIFDPRVGEAITSMGQVCLKVARKVIEHQGYDVIYGDTDSCAFSIPGNYTTEEIVKKSEVIAEQVGFAMNYFAKTRFNVRDPKMEVSVDKVYEKMYFSRAKKRYAGLMSWKGVYVNPPKLKVSGFESKRADWPDFIKDIQKQVFMKRFDGKSDLEIAEDIKKIISDLYAGKYDKSIEQRKVVRQKLEDYKSNTPHVRGAKLWQEKTGKEFKIAQEIRYHLCTNKKVIPVIEGEDIKIPKEAYDYVKGQLMKVLDRLEIPTNVVNSQKLLTQVYSDEPNQELVAVADKKRKK